MLYLLEADRIEGLSTNHTKARITVRESHLDITTDSPVETALQVRLFALDGREMTRHTFPTGQSNYSLTLPKLPPGVYAVQLGGSERYRGSTLIRITQR